MVAIGEYSRLECVSWPLLYVMDTIAQKGHRFPGDNKCVRGNEGLGTGHCLPDLLLALVKNLHGHLVDELFFLGVHLRQTHAVNDLCHK